MLREIGSLRILRLNDTRITDGGIPAIASINGLISVDLSGQVSLLQNNLNFDQVIVMNGEEIPVDDNQFSYLFSPSAASNIVYSCDEDTLFLNYAPEGTLGPIKYNRLK